MKYATLIATVILFALNLQAQKFYSFPEFKLIAGVWESRDSTNHLTVSLEIAELELDTASVSVLELRLKYVQNDKVIENTLESYTPIIVTGYVFDSTQTKISFEYKDARKNKNGNGTIELIKGSPDKLVWTLQNTKAVLSQRLPDLSFSLPVKTELYKDAQKN